MKRVLQDSSGTGIDHFVSMQPFFEFFTLSNKLGNSEIRPHPDLIHAEVDNFEDALIDAKQRVKECHLKLVFLPDKFVDFLGQLIFGLLLVKP